MGKAVSWLDAFGILLGRGLPDRRRSTAVLVQFFVLLFAGIALLESACYPWAHTLWLRRALTGTWVGELTATGRGQHVAFVDWRDDIGEAAGPDLSGVVKMCASHGESHE